MSDPFLPIAAGFVLGSLHALDADHITAVSVFVSRNPQPRRAMMLGFRWAIGHTATLLIFGLTALGLKLVITPAIEATAEAGIGLILILLGGWSIRGLLRHQRIHIHRHLHDGVEHVHFHSHAEHADHRHEHSLFVVGAAHGVAGTASVLLVIPVTIVTSVLAASLYIVLFGIGTMIAMALFAYALGRVILLFRLKNALVWIQGIAGSMCILIGSWWILERLI